MASYIIRPNRPDTRVGDHCVMSCVQFDWPEPSAAPTRAARRQRLEHGARLDDMLRRARPYRPARIVRLGDHA